MIQNIKTMSVISLAIKLYVKMGIRAKISVVNPVENVNNQCQSRLRNVGTFKTYHVHSLLILLFVKPTVLNFCNVVINVFDGVVRPVQSTVLKR